ncbi:hypothetical protein BDD26_1870 [Xenorhabdus cabanillasii]|uniref:Uncharacterized protein n=1 Tax=Xenorhabdus cabanillasii TaxID=351673 RepID=A0A3D9UCM3_9GAMM|nr:hypothetical protein Xcab_01127 [Xenorhabdus cabanillasii JM26]REF27129.1 hypothetical protein BDD26_1870 [Xenorhabdus cabanillasii]
MTSNILDYTNIVDVIASRYKNHYILFIFQIATFLLIIALAAFTHICYPGTVIYGFWRLVCELFVITLQLEFDLGMSNLLELSKSI